MNQKSAKLYLRTSMYPSERVNGKMNRVESSFEGYMDVLRYNLADF